MTWTRTPPRVWAVMVRFKRASRPGMRCLAVAAAASALARASSPVFHSGLALGLGLAAMIACICGLISSLVGAGSVRAGKDRSSARAIPARESPVRPQARTRPRNEAKDKTRKKKKRKNKPPERRRFYAFSGEAPNDLPFALSPH